MSNKSKPLESYKLPGPTGQGWPQPGRKPEECTPDNDIERLAEFTDNMRLKWNKGRKEHGTVVKIDPIEEAQQECLDIANYAMDTYFRLKYFRERLPQILQEAADASGKTSK